MNNLFQVVTIPIKKLADLLFGLSIGNTNLGSIIVVGVIFCVIIEVIMHATNHGVGIGSLIGRIRKKKK